MDRKGERSALRAFEGAAAQSPLPIEHQVTNRLAFVAEPETTIRHCSMPLRIEVNRAIATHASPTDLDLLLWLEYGD
jgi:hypothetical protein